MSLKVRDTTGTLHDIAGLTKVDTTLDSTSNHAISNGAVTTALGNKVNEPSSEGTSGQVLTTDGSGGRTWTTVHEEDVLRTETMETIGGTASKAYSVGEYFIGTDGLMYKVTAAIASGGTITVNTNCVKAPIEEVLEDCITSDGGTVTGVISRKDDDVDISETNNGVSATKYLHVVQSCDADDHIIARLESQVQPDGKVAACLYSRNYNTSGEIVGFNALKCITDKSGVCTYGISSSHNFNAELGMGYAICSTAAATVDKVASLNNYKITYNTYVTVKFDYDVPANATLNINNQGAHAIYYHGSPIKSGRILAGDFATFILTPGLTYILVGIDRAGCDAITSAGGTIQDNIVRSQYNDIDVLQSNNGVSSQTYRDFGQIRDKNSKILGELRTVVSPGGEIGTEFTAVNYNTSGTLVGEKRFRIWNSKNGTASYNMSDAYNFTPILGIGYGTCDTAAATAAKVVSFPYYDLVTNGYVTIKFTNAVPANATLNINSRGAKAIYYRGAAITANKIKAGDRATFIYNGGQYDLIANDGWGSNY